MKKETAEKENTASACDAWRSIVEAELKGAPFEKKLVSPTFEGIALQPVYTAHDTEGLAAIDTVPGFPPYLRGSRASGYTHHAWQISQELDFASPAEFNEAARNCVDRGLTALNIVLDRATRDGHDPDWAGPGEVGVGGLSLATLEDLDRALLGINLEKISLFIRSGSSAMPLAALLMAMARRRKHDVRKLRGCIEMDPIGVMSHEGKLPQSLSSAYREMAGLTRWAHEHAPRLQTICVHTRAWHESGGSAVQELAFGLATAAEYLRALDDHGLPAGVAAPRLRFAVTVGHQFFMEISKLRALRALWSHMVAAMGANAEAQRLHVHARTSHRNKTAYDPHVNLLRGTVEALAAVFGGCDSLQVGAFDEVFQSPDDFSRRIARNTQLILANECQLTRFVDPAGGAWYVETLTDQLARRAWSLFQKVEELGGMSKALAAGFVQDEIEKVQRRREDAAASRRAPIVGTTKYANPREERGARAAADRESFQRARRRQIVGFRTAADDIDNQMVLQQLDRMIQTPPEGIFEACITAVSRGATLGEVTRALRISDRPGAGIRPVTMRRLAEPFERLRERVAERAKTPKGAVSVFLANMGPAAQHRTRAEFSTGFFEVADFKVTSPAGFKSVEDAAAAAAAARPDIVTICSTDETYPQIVPALAAALKEKIPGVIVVLAGFPEDHVQAFRQAGVDEFIHLKANALNVLSQLFQDVEDAR